MKKELTPPARLLVLDVGERFVGMAVIDSAWSVATPRGIFERQSWKIDRPRWNKIFHNDGEAFTGIVLGMPLSEDGQLGTQARRILSFRNLLCQVFSFPIVLQDERYSSFQARLWNGRANRIDDLAALDIARRFLDRQSS